MKVCPPIVTVPVLWLDVELDATDKLTVPFPFPLPPAVTVIQPTLLVADQEQPLGAVTFVLALPPLAPIVVLEGESE